MSLYEILAVAALLAAGGFAYRLYRLDTKPGAPTPPPANRCSREIAATNAERRAI
jgi:hypothetical protein